MSEAANRPYEAIDTKTPYLMLVEKEEGKTEEERRVDTLNLSRMKWASENKKRFKTIDFWCNNQNMTITEIARRLKISRMTVTRHLKPIKLKID